MITQRRDGPPVILPSLLVVVCTIKKNDLWFFSGLPNVLLYWFCGRVEWRRTANPNTPKCHQVIGLFGFLSCCSCLFQRYLSPRYLSITVRATALFTFFIFGFYTNRLVSGSVLGGCLKHSTLVILLYLSEYQVSVYRHVSGKCDAVCLLRIENPLSTVCIKWLASKLCCAVSSGCLCLYH